MAQTRKRSNNAQAKPVAVPSPMATLPVGATFGSLVHAVLEHADPGGVICTKRTSSLTSWSWSALKP